MIKKFFICLAAILIVFSAASCDGGLFQGDFNYSEDGKSEAGFYFTAFNNAGYEGSFGWRFIYTDEGEDRDVTVTVKTKKVGNEYMVSMHIKDDELDMSMINNIENVYYIDHKAKTVSGGSQEQIDEFLISQEITDVFGRVNFNDETERSWRFVERKDASILDKNGVEIDTFEFVYSLEEHVVNSLFRGAATLKLNFLRNFPAIARMQFIIEPEGGPVTMTVYIVEISAAVDDEDFVIPGEAQGYTTVEE